MFSDVPENFKHKHSFQVCIYFTGLSEISRIFKLCKPIESVDQV